MASYHGTNMRTNPPRHVWYLDLEEMDRLEAFARKVADRRTDRDLDGRADWLQDLEGFMAEYAACAHYGTEFAWDVISERGDDGCDVLVDGRWRMGVKGSRYPNPFLLVKTADKKNVHGYALVRVNTDTGRCELVGWARAGHVHSLTPKRKHQNGPLNYEVPCREMIPCRPPRIREAELDV